MAIAAFHEFAGRAALAQALARAIASLARPGFRLALSGGTTPALFFAELGDSAIDWRQITVTLVDERDVPEDHPRSNAGLLRRALTAPHLNFVGLHRNEAAAAALLPLDAAVLGMGADGHTASFFPGGDRLAEALDPTAPPGLVRLSAPGAGEPRITFNLSALLATSTLALHIEGRDKREVLERALMPGPVAEMPVRALLAAAHPIDIYWCP